MVSLAQDLLGIGLYTPAEAARYARIQTQLMNRWVFGNRTGKPVIHAQLGQQEDDDRIVTFLDFIQALSIRAIRENYKGISIQAIRDAVEMAREKYKVEYPFARQHRTYMWVREERARRLAKKASEEGAAQQDEEPEPSCEIVLELEADKHVQLTGKKRGNLVAKQALELHLQDLKFNEAGLACEYLAMTRDGLSVSMNPSKRFGEPLVPSRYSAQTLYEASVAEGSVQAVAKLYGVDVKEVELACHYISFLQAPVA